MASRILSTRLLIATLALLASFSCSGGSDPVGPDASGGTDVADAAPGETGAPDGTFDAGSDPDPDLPDADGRDADVLGPEDTDGSGDITPDAGDVSADVDVGDAVDAPDGDADGGVDTFAFTYALDVATNLLTPDVPLEIRAVPMTGAPTGTPTFLWDADGGEILEDDGEGFVVMRFPAPGTYLVPLTITDEAGETYEDGAYIVVVEASGHAVGDVNDDGVLTTADLDIIDRWFSGEQIDADQFERADLWADRLVDPQDRAAISDAVDAGALAPTLLDVDAGAVGRRVRLIHPALLDPSGVATVTFTGSDPMTPFRPEPGYANFFVPPGLDPDPAATLSLLIDDVVVATFPFELLPPPEPRAVPGELVLDAFATSARLSAELAPAMTEWLENLPADDAVLAAEEVEAMRGMLSESAVILAEQSAEMNRIFAELTPEARAGLEAIFLANGLAEVVDALDAIEAGLGSEKMVPGSLLPVLCAAQKIADITDRIAEITGTVLAFVNHPVVRVLEWLPGVAPFIRAFRAVTNIVDAVTEIVQLVMVFIPSVEDDIRVTTEPPILLRGQRTTVAASVRLLMFRNICNRGSAALAAGIEDMLTKALTNVIARRMPAMGPAFRAVDEKEERLNRVWRRVYGVIAWVSGRTVSSLGLGQAVGSLAQRLCDYLRGDDEPFMSLPDAALDASCGAIDGRGQWTCTDACAGRVNLRAQEELCGGALGVEVAEVTCLACDAGSCTDGCCAIEGCIPVVEQHAGACGVGGAVCAECGPAQVCNAGVCECEHACDVPGEMRCGAGRVVETCAVNEVGCRAWEVVESCPEMCIAGECRPCAVGSCTPGVPYCIGDFQAQCFEDPATGCGEGGGLIDCLADGLTCVGGDCVCPPPICAPGDRQCDGTVIQTCGVDGRGCAAWVDDSDCAASGTTCVAGACDCPERCADGDLRCDGTVSERCTTEFGVCGDWIPVEDCAANAQECNAGVCECAPDACSIGTSYCEGEELVDCVAHPVSGCGIIGDCTPCRAEDGLVCLGETCECAAGGCTLGETTCNGDVVETCQENEVGCPVFVPTTDCAASSTTCSGGACDCAGGCTEGDTRCLLSVSQLCSAELDVCGEWFDVEDCADSGEVCGASGCECAADACAVGANFCDGDDVVACVPHPISGCGLPGGRTTCSVADGLTCISDACACAPGGCTLGETTCDGDVVETCEENAFGCPVFVATTDCAASSTTCSGGACDCTGGCSNGDTRCTGSVSQFCTTASDVCGEWDDVLDCSLSGRVCSGGSCACDPGACTVGTSFCDGDDVVDCVAAPVSGCGIPGGRTTCSVADGLTCIGDACACAPGGCTLGETTCNGDVVETCEENEFGCPVFVPTTDCAASSTVCSGGACDCTGGCSNGDTRCTGSVSQFCTTASNVCGEWVDVLDCSPAGLVCSSGSCACPAAECSIPSTQCGADGVQTCTTNGSGCLVWGPDTPCPDGEACSGGECVPDTCCTEFSYQCNGDVLEYCAFADPCNTWVTDEDCTLTGRTCDPFDGCVSPSSTCLDGDSFWLALQGDGSSSATVLYNEFTFECSVLDGVVLSDDAIATFTLETDGTYSVYARDEGLSEWGITTNTSGSGDWSVWTHITEGSSQQVWLERPGAIFGPDLDLAIINYRFDADAITFLGDHVWPERWMP